MRGELTAAVPRERFHEPVRPSVDAARERSNDGVRLLVGQPHEHDVSGLTLNERRDEGSPRPFQ